MARPEAQVIDAVLSYHMNPQTCGVAKFNHLLAQRLGVPCLGLGAWSRHMKGVLLSVKSSECADDWHSEMELLSSFHVATDLLLHDRPRWVPTYARRVFYADEIGCPSTLNGDASRGAYRVLVFGMAHKLNLPHFEQLKARLDEAHPDYTIELSTAVHEGSPWDEALTDSISAMRSIFGSRLRVLGFLGDDGLALALHDVDAVACYFTPALRANNTSYWAAVDAGKTIYTNRDEFSPKEGERKTWDDLIELIRA